MIRLPECDDSTGWLIEMLSQAGTSCGSQPPGMHQQGSAQPHQRKFSILPPTPQRDAPIVALGGPLKKGPYVSVIGVSSSIVLAMEAGVCQTSKPERSERKGNQMQEGKHTPMMDPASSSIALVTAAPPPLHASTSTTARSSASMTPAFFA